MKMIRDPLRRGKEERAWSVGPNDCSVGLVCETVAEPFSTQTFHPSCTSAKNVWSWVSGNSENMAVFCAPC